MSARSILVLNAGSSSIKFSLFGIKDDGALDLDLNGKIDGIGTAHARLQIHHPERGAQRALDEREGGSHQAAIALLTALLPELCGGAAIAAVGHRIVHGGTRFTAPIYLNESVLTALDKLVPLAPLHQPHNLAVARAIAAALPDVPQFGCFDTAFHRGHDAVVELFALPWSMYEAGICRYGFHGLSYEYIASALPTLAPAIAGRRVIVAHLGNGASLCALDGGRSVDSTMGFSALDGVPMGTRCGQLDPGVILYLLREHGLDADELEQLLYHRSGLLGLSGLSGDMRDLLQSDAPRAKLALDYYVFRIAREIAALTSTLGGLDGLVFTAGIGENSAGIRGRLCERLGWLGVRLDAAANTGNEPCISAPESAVSVWALPTDEERVIAAHTLALLEA